MSFREGPELLDMKRPPFFECEGELSYRGWTMMTMGSIKGTPAKFNIAPEKWWLEDYFPIGKVTFPGLC